MSDLGIEDRIKLAVQFIAQSPPGEVNDVIQDIASIIGDNDALTPHVAAALKVYNLAQMTTVEHAADGEVDAHVSLLSPATTLPGHEDRYIDPEAKRTFTFDHVRLVPLSYEPYILPELDEAFRSELAASLLAYARNHFTEGCSSVSTNQVPIAPRGLDVVKEEAEEEAEAEEVVGSHDGAIERESTPTVPDGGIPNADAEVDAPGAIDKLDEEIAQVGAEEEKEEALEVKEAQANADADADADAGVEAATAGVAALGVGSPDGMVEPVHSRAEDVNADAKPDDEVDAPGGLEKFDEEIREVQQEEGAADEEEKEAAKRAHAAELEAVAAGEEEPEAVSQQSETVAQQPAAASQQLDNPLFVLEIVGNRYKASNFWTGRWRTRWTVDRAAGTVSGIINVDVHYYEQGNVQLSTKHEASFPCPTEPLKGQSVASQIVTSIAKIETNYQLEMNDVYEYMSGTAFRNLRRALPVTRQKLDWDKVQGYALGADLSRARAAA